MRWLLFLARIAFICNLFFLLCVVLRYWDVLQDQSIKGFIIILGWLMAPLLNLVFNISFVIAYYRRKEPINIPGWLIAANLIIQVLQFIFIPLV